MRGMAGSGGPTGRAQIWCEDAIARAGEEEVSTKVFGLGFYTILYGPNMVLKGANLAVSRGAVQMAVVPRVREAMDAVGKNIKTLESMASRTQGTTAA
ncbi:hypothetical protein MGN70_012917 [Eutypa lata]|nr:hypothetical protein MGN70_012917 [Eutypa lata]